MKVLARNLIFLLLCGLMSNRAACADGELSGNGDILCADGQCRPAVVETTFAGRAAYSLTNGRSIAVIVPDWGRVMSFGAIGGDNWLWNNTTAQQNEKDTKNSWINRGGDKSWPAPQSSWPLWTGESWPPPLAWDSKPHRAEVISGGAIRTQSEIDPGLGARLIREYRFDENGDFVIAQTVEKISGAPQMMALWSVTQIVTPDAVFLPTQANSAYRDGLHWLMKPKTAPLWNALSPTLLQVAPDAEATFKIGVDAPVSALLAVRGRTAFVQRAARPEGQYPDGAKGAGFPVEFYNFGHPQNSYSELELLSPLRVLRAGARWTHTVRWSLHPLPDADFSSPATRAVLEALLRPVAPDNAA